MSNKIRKKKKSSSFRRAQKLFSNVTIWSWESMTDPNDTHQRISHAEAKIGHVVRQLSQDKVNTITSQPNNWVLCCRSLCWTGQGNFWVEQDIISFRNYNINKFSEEYDKMRAYVMTQCQKRHIYDVGWIIQTFDKESKIDSGIELLHLGAINETRRYDWLLTEEAAAKTPAEKVRIREEIDK